MTPFDCAQNQGPKGGWRGITPIPAALVVLFGIASPAEAQTAISGDFYYSTFSTSTTDTVGEGTFDWTGSTLTATTTTLATLPSSAIDGSLAIGSDEIGRASCRERVEIS